MTELSIEQLQRERDYFRSKYHSSQEALQAYANPENWTNVDDDKDVKVKDWWCPVEYHKEDRDCEYDGTYFARKALERDEQGKELGLVECEGCDRYVPEDIAWGPDVEGVYLCPPCAYEFLNNENQELSAEVTALIDANEAVKKFWEGQTVQININKILTRLPEEKVAKRRAEIEALNAARAVVAEYQAVKKSLDKEFGPADDSTGNAKRLMEALEKLEDME
jgi:hypothetical protein